VVEPNSSDLPALPASPALPAVSSCMPSRLRPVFTDIQFWVPVAVLLVGALILFWVSR